METTAYHTLLAHRGMRYALMKKPLKVYKIRSFIGNNITNQYYPSVIPV